MAPNCSAVMAGVIRDGVTTVTQLMLAAAKEEFEKTFGAAVSRLLRVLLRCGLCKLNRYRTGPVAPARDALRVFHKRRRVEAQRFRAVCTDHCGLCVGSPCDADTVWPTRCNRPQELCCDRPTRTVRIGRQRVSGRYCRSALPPLAPVRPRASPRPSPAPSPSPLPRATVAAPAACASCADCVGRPCPGGAFLPPFGCDLCCDPATAAVRAGAALVAGSGRYCAPPAPAIPYCADCEDCLGQDCSEGFVAPFKCGLCCTRDTHEVVRGARVPRGLACERTTPSPTATGTPLVAPTSATATASASVTATVTPTRVPVAVPGNATNGTQSPCCPSPKEMMRAIYEVCGPVCVPGG